MGWAVRPIDASGKADSPARRRRIVEQRDGAPLGIGGSDGEGLHAAYLQKNRRQESHVARRLSRAKAGIEGQSVSQVVEELIRPTATPGRVTPIVNDVFRRYLFQRPVFEYPKIGGSLSKGLVASVPSFLLCNSIYNCFLYNEYY